MALYKRGKKGVLWTRFTGPNGRLVRESCKTTDRKLAEQYEAKLKRELWQVHQLGERPRRTWPEAVERWVSDNRERPSHYDDVLYIRWLDPYLGERYLDQIDADVIRRIKQDRLNQGLSASAVNKPLQLVRGILRAACYDWNWIDKVPAVKLVKEAQRRIRWLTEDEETRLLAELPEHLAEMVRFSLATGLRMSNVTGLEWSQVDLAHRRAWIHPDQAKARQAIPVPLNGEALAVLRRQEGKNARWCFTYQGERIRRTNGRAWREALNRAGIPDFRWHDLRHTWATRLMQAGVPLHALMELGGWQDIAMVRKYAHLAPETLAQYAEAACRQRPTESTNLAHELESAGQDFT